MNFRRFEDAATFLEATEPLLHANEAKYGLILGVAERCRDGEPYSPEPPWFAAIEEAGRATVASIHTPPFALGLTDATESAIEEIIEALITEKRWLPGVVAPAKTAQLFGRLWRRTTGAQVETAFRQALHRLDQVEKIAIPRGRMRTTHRIDTELARHWTHRFQIDCRLPEAETEPPTRVLALEEGRLFFWEDDNEPRAMAAWSRPTPNGVCIGYVYTPDQYRGRGYASALVASLSQKLLDEGKSFCCLFTDLANPVSNRIYQRIGYRRICDFQHEVFDPVRSDLGPS
jgi:predicted GNAT family acetyltransferase